MTASAATMRGTTKAALAQEPTKPKRAYTEYNIFFQLERVLVLQSMTSNGAPFVDEDREDAPPYSAIAYGHPPLPSRYRHIALPSNWFDSSQKKKRKHRKSHGMIGFAELSKEISKRWSRVDGETKAYCKRMANFALEKYRLDMLAYEKQMKLWKGEQTPEKVSSAPKTPQNPPHTGSMPDQKTTTSSGAFITSHGASELTKRLTNTLGVTSFPVVQKAERRGSAPSAMTYPVVPPHPVGSMPHPAAHHQVGNAKQFPQRTVLSPSKLDEAQRQEFHLREAIARSVVAQLKGVQKEHNHLGRQLADHVICENRQQEFEVHRRQTRRRSLDLVQSDQDQLKGQEADRHVKRVQKRRASLDNSFSRVSYLQRGHAVDEQETAHLHQCLGDYTEDSANGQSGRTREENAGANSNCTPPLTPPDTPPPPAGPAAGHHVRFASTVAGSSTRESTFDKSALMESASSWLKSFHSLDDSDLLKSPDCSLKTIMNKDILDFEADDVPGLLPPLSKTRSQKMVQAQSSRQGISNISMSSFLSDPPKKESSRSIKLWESKHSNISMMMSDIDTLDLSHDLSALDLSFPVVKQ